VPKYIVERTFSAADGRLVADAAIARRNAALGVTWLHSYVSRDRRTTFCVYDAPSAEAIRATAFANDLPVDGITEVRLMDPYAW
jgi:hypothetical protein